MNVAEYFGGTYAAARDKFLRAAQTRDADIVRHMHPRARGADGEDLSIDVATLGDANASNLLFLTSGTHGAEGFCGSGCQVAMLGDERFLKALATADCCAVMLHALNPYGFSHLRRTNEDNVDLNRNFRDFSLPPARNDAYADIHTLIVPPTWPPTLMNEAQLFAYAARHGVNAVQSAVSGGQCDFADGLFYGGVGPAWSNATLREVLRAVGAQRKRIAWIDFHTGLGPWGHGEKIHNGGPAPEALARSRRWWGDEVTSFYDGSSTSAVLTGINSNAMLEECPRAEYAGIALEYGTVPFMDVLQALRADQWLQNHPDTGAAQRSAIKQQVRDAFYGDRDDWKCRVVDQARDATYRALAQLAH